MNLPYIPNARMDRVKNNDEVFTLRYFCEFINGLNFSGVYVLDAHSDVSTALLNNCFEENPKEYIEQAIAKLEREILFFISQMQGRQKDILIYFLNFNTVMEKRNEIGKLVKFSD